MSEDRLEDLPPHGRRDFFAAGLSRLLRPLAGYIESRMPIELPPPRRLRPPGAVAEDVFLDVCYRCGNCGDACPASAIEQIRDCDERLDGTPQIDPNRQACVICEDLACMEACPSGALKPLDKFAIRMGLAWVDHGVCLRSKGDDCIVCLERCPLGEVAIKKNEKGRVQVVAPSQSDDGRGCTGCGICQQYCPTHPTRAIQVEAR